MVPQGQEFKVGRVDGDLSNWRWPSCVVVWLCGCVVVWLCGCVVVWLCGCVVVVVVVLTFTKTRVINLVLDGNRSFWL